MNVEGIETNREIESYIKYYQTPFGREVMQWEASFLSKNTSPNASLLSIGCGPAIIEQYLQRIRPDIKLIATDINRDMIESASPLPYLVLADGEHLPFKKSQFDVVVCITSLEFMKAPEVTLQNIHEVLKPNGVFLALMLNPDSMNIKEKINNPDSYIGRHLQHREYDKIQTTFRRFFHHVILSYALEKQNETIKEKTTQHLAQLLIMKGKK